MAAAGLLCLPVSLAAQHPLVTLPLDDPAYVQLEGLARMGCAEARVSAFRPYPVGAVRRALREAAADPYCTGRVLTSLLVRFGDGTQSGPDTLLAPDSLNTIAPDLARAAREAALEPADDGQLRYGAAATLRATSLTKGEFSPLWSSVTDKSEGDPSADAILRARLTWEAHPRFVLVAEGYGETNRRNDPQVKSRRFRRTSGAVDFSEAYMTGRLGPVLLSVGRAPEAWLGHDRESLMLSANGPPLDRILASITTRHFELRGIYASLNQVVLDSATDDFQSSIPNQRFYRTLVAHALVWRPTPAVELTLGETALLSRGARTLDVSYLNPLAIYVVTQNDSGRAGEDNRDNLTTFGGLRMRAGAVTLSGELLVDDIQIDRADRARTPDQLGWRFAASAPLPLVRPASVGVEYRRIDSYTYQRAHYNEVYQNYDRPLGSELGPDADLLSAQAELWTSGTVRLSGSIGGWRRGVLRIFDRPGDRATGNAGTAFPRVTAGTVVQKAVLGDLALQYLSPIIPVTLRLQTARIENVNNLPSSAALYVRAQLIGTYAFRYP